MAILPQLFSDCQPARSTTALPKGGPTETVGSRSDKRSHHARRVTRGPYINRQPPVHQATESAPLPTCLEHTIERS